MRILRFIAPLVLLMAVATGCSTYSLVSSEVYNGADLRAYSTYRIVTPADNDSVKLPPGMTMADYYCIASAIGDQMAARGYSQSPTAPLLINIGMVIHHGIVTEPLMLPVNYYPGPPPPPIPGYGPWWMYPRQAYWGPAYYNTGYQVIAGTYREGILMMDIVDTRSKKPVYSSAVAAIMNNGAFADQKGINQAVSTLFSQFPVKPQKQ